MPHGDRTTIATAVLLSTHVKVYIYAPLLALQARYHPRVNLRLLRLRLINFIGQDRNRLIRFAMRPKFSIAEQ